LWQPLHLNGFKAKLIDETTLEVDVPREQAMNDLFIQLSEQGINIVGLRNKTNRLEELFMNRIQQNKNQDTPHDH
jgi:ABC-2 type transport system ATP-binding protein